MILTVPGLKPTQLGGQTYMLLPMTPIQKRILEQLVAQEEQRVPLKPPLRPPSTPHSAFVREQEAS